jgi:small subunit ribosomal protein S2
MAQVSIRDLLQAGAHFGHQTRFWNPKMGESFSAPATRFTSSTSTHRQALNDALTYANGWRPQEQGPVRRHQARRFRDRS